MTANDRPDRDDVFRLLFASNPLPMWVYDLATMYFLEVNDAAVAHYGYSREEFLRMRITAIRPPEDEATVTANVAKLVAGADRGVRRIGTWTHRLKDGRDREVDISSHSIDFGGRRAALVVARDVTDLKQAEITLKKYAERLEVLHDIDAAIIAAQAPEAIAEQAIRRLRKLLSVPRAIVNIFDLEAGEVEWLAAAGRRRIHVGPGVRFPLAFMGDVEALRRGELQIVDVDALPRSPEAAALLGSGVHVYMVVPMIAAGELIGALSFGGEPREFPAEQVSIAQEAAAQLAIALAQSRLQEKVKRHAVELEARVLERTLALHSANERLEREIADRRRAEAGADHANRAKSEFLSRMSHELRTPLNGILGFAQLLEAAPLSDDDRESVEHILKGGRHLLGLINEVLDISRIEAGRLSISLEPVLASDVCSVAVDLVRPQAAQRQVEMEMSVPDGLYVMADRQRLQQVLLNLLSNAVKYNVERGRVTLACQRAAGRAIRISVTDTGVGIAPDAIGRLFTPFDRLGAEQTAVEGTGLGLTLSKRLVEAMGGTIAATSAPGRGTTLTIELPAAAEPTERHAAPTTGPAAPRRGEARGTVLYIEDNLSNLRLLERVLAHRAGVTLVSAMQGRRGLELARDHRPHLIILDLHLPDMSGRDVFTELRAEPATSAIPVIILSADATPHQVERLLADGARSYLTKPLDVQVLLTVLDDLLGKEADAR